MIGIGFRDPFPVERTGDLLEAGHPLHAGQPLDMPAFADPSVFQLSRQDGMSPCSSFLCI